MPHTDVIPTSATVSATGLGIRYIGKHCFAYSGEYPSTTSAQTLLSFTTGNGYIEGTFVMFPSVKFSSPGAGGYSTMRVTFNGLIIAVIKGTTDYPAETGGNNEQLTCIIPPLTSVLIEMDTNDDTADELIFVTFTGRVYGAE